MTVVTLMPTDPKYVGGGRYRLMCEDKRAYYVKPLDNPNCPQLIMPKFAWKEVKH